MNTQSLLDRAMQIVVDTLRCEDCCQCSVRLLIAEYEAHKAAPVLPVEAWRERDGYKGEMGKIFDEIGKIVEWAYLEGEEHNYPHLIKIFGRKNRL